MHCTSKDTPIHSPPALESEACIKDRRRSDWVFLSLLRKVRRGRNASSKSRGFDSWRKTYTVMLLDISKTVEGMLLVA